MTKSEIQQIGFLIFPGFPMACLTSMIEPLRAANEIAGQLRFGWKLVSEDGSKVTSSAEVSFEPDCALAEAQALDVLFLLSSPGSRFVHEKASNGILRGLQRHGVTLGGISGGVFPLVRSGVMEQQRCSVHWCYEAAFRAEFPQVDAADEVIVTSGRCHTASGAAAAFDLALRMVEEVFGADVAHEVACWFQHPMMRGEGVRQRIPMQESPDARFPDLVARAAALFSQHIEETTSINEVAEALAVSPRQIERAFKKATGQSPSHYYRALRMKAARQLVLYSKDSFADVAAAVGYASTTPLKAHYSAAFGVSPQEDRARINSFRVRDNIPVPSV